MSEQPAGRETEEMTSGTASPQSPQSTESAESAGEDTDISFRSEAGPDEELTVGDDVNPSATSEASVEPPD